MILHDVGAMNHEDQLRLLAWSEHAAGKTQIVSTAPTPLMPLVQAGLFNDTLYYRLNTVFVDATAPARPEVGDRPLQLAPAVVSSPVVVAGEELLEDAADTRTDPVDPRIVLRSVIRSPTGLGGPTVAFRQTDARRGRKSNC